MIAFSDRCEDALGMVHVLLMGGQVSKADYEQAWRAFQTHLMIAFSDGSDDAMKMAKGLFNAGLETHH